MNLKSNISIFIFVCLLFFIYLYIYEYFLASDAIVHNFYAELLSDEDANGVIEYRKKWKLLSYSIIPILVLIRTNLVALCISVGLFFYDTENKIKYKQIFRITLFSELVLVLVGYFKFIYFHFIETDFTLQDLQQFHPLSYINFLDISKIEPWLRYPLQTINLFEIGYFLVLVYGLQKLLKNKYSKSFEMIAVSYGSGLVIWIGLMMFLTLNMS
jgi:hypothetical protein